MSEPDVRIQEKIKVLREDLCDLAKNCGRKADAVQLVLVTKKVSEERIREAFASGEREFGENRVQELLQKKAILPSEIRWHLIGNLQTNKVKQVLGEVVLIHSLDRRELAGEIERQAELKNILEVPCLVQVNLAREDSKSGLLIEELDDFLTWSRSLARVQIKGLMTIGPNTKEVGRIREVFRQAKKVQEDLKVKFPEKSWDVLSMGMSGDFQIAVEEGATMVRIGSAVFGERT